MTGWIQNYDRPSEKYQEAQEDSKEDKKMYRYEVAWEEQDKTYRWKGFGDPNKFQKFVRGLVKKGFKILNISDWDSEGIGSQLKAEFIK